MNNLRKVKNDILKDWIEFREETLSIMSEEDKKHFMYFEEISKNYRECKNFYDTPFGKLFLEKCRKNVSLQESLLKNLRRYDEKLSEEIRLDEKRKLMREQMGSMSDILRDFSRKFSKSPLVDNELSAEIKNIFNAFNVRCTKVLCILDINK